MNNLGKISFMDEAAAAVPEMAEESGDNAAVLDCLMQTKEALANGDVDNAMMLLDKCIELAGGMASVGDEMAPGAVEEPAY